MTAASCSGIRDSRVNGAPISPLRFPGVFSVQYRWERTPASSSFKVVFPMLPVICTTGIWNCPRYQEAKSRRAALVFSTNM